MAAEDYARLDKPGDLILSTGIPNYDPKTFKDRLIGIYRARKR